MTIQRSDCCKATIDLDKTKERPECYTCSECGRIIGSPLPQPTMNQIPNIEETHDTEVEETKPWWNKLKEALEQKDKYNYCKVDATDLEFSIVDYYIFHQQLQKAREEAFIEKAWKFLHGSRGKSLSKEDFKNGLSELDQNKK